MRASRLSLALVICAAMLGWSAVVTSQSEEDSEQGAQPRYGSIEYGQDDPSRQVVHVFTLEDRGAPRPAVILFHGGALIQGSPDELYMWGRRLAELGYVTFLAGYRLFDERSGANPWPTQLEDAQRAVRWIRAHAVDFGIDPERVCAAGQSSGGHLAGLLGTTEAMDDSDPALAGISSRVDCVISIAGDVDLTVPYTVESFTSLLEAMFGVTLEEGPAVWQAASPAHNVDEETVPFLIIAGSEDSLVPVEMARNLADALAAAGREYVFAELPAGHFDLESLELTKRLVEAFLAAQLHPER